MVAKMSWSLAYCELGQTEKWRKQKSGANRLNARFQTCNWNVYTFENSPLHGGLQVVLSGRSTSRLFHAGFGLLVCQHLHYPSLREFQRRHNTIIDHGNRCFQFQRRAFVASQEKWRRRRIRFSFFFYDKGADDLRGHRSCCCTGRHCSMPL